MLKAWLFCAWGVLAAGPAQAPAPFSGCIVYENEYQTGAGETLYYAVKPKNWLYIQGNRYKLLDRKEQPMELYLGAKNELYTFPKGQAVRWPDTTRRAARAVLTCLPATATILGYRCQVLRLVQGGTATLVFYAPALHVNPLDFSHCPSPYWSALLQATDGALPLRTIVVDAQHDVTATSEAIAVRPGPLTDADFTTIAPAR